MQVWSNYIFLKSITITFHNLQLLFKIFPYNYFSNLQLLFKIFRDNYVGNLRSYWQPALNYFTQLFMDAYNRHIMPFLKFASSTEKICTGQQSITMTLSFHTFNFNFTSIELINYNCSNPGYKTITHVL